MGSELSEVDFLLQYSKGVERELCVNEIGAYMVTLASFSRDKCPVLRLQA